MADQGVNQTGRSTGRPTGKLKTLLSPPIGEPWVWQTRALLSSPAWRAQSVNCRRLIDFILVEHMNHSGLENGNLKATYDQLVDCGLTRSEIRSATEVAEFLGLLKVIRGGRWAETNQPSIYRLIFLPTAPDMQPPTNEWKGKTEEAIAEWKADRASRARNARERRKIKNKILVRLPELP